MNRALAAYTPRVKALNYDALRSILGCQNISGNDIFATSAFTQVCVAPA